jgi:hypothetical protein
MSTDGDRLGDAVVDLEDLEVVLGDSGQVVLGHDACFHLQLLLLRTFLLRCYVACRSSAS